MRGHIRQRGSRWTVVLDLGRDEAGRRKQKWLSGYRSKREAELALTRALAAQDQGERAPGAPTKLTFGTFLLDKWLPHLANRVQVASLRPSTYAFYAEIVAAHIIPAIGHVRLRALESDQLEACYASLLRSGRKVRPGQLPAPLGATRVRAVAVTVNASLRWAVRQRLIARNPASEVAAMPKASGEQRACWTPEEASCFLTATADDRLHALYVLAATSGMRRGEVVGLGWDQVDFDAGTVTVTRARISVGGRTLESTPKTAKGRRCIAIAEPVVHALQAWRKHQLEERLAWGPGWTDSGFVFTWEDGRPYLPQYVLRSFQRAASRAGLPVIAFHGLRHTAATLGLASGVPLLAMSRRLGHSSVSVTADIYSHTVEAVDRDAAERTAAVLMPRVANS